MKTSIFREYDIRGIVGKELEISKVYNLAKAIITYFKKQNPELNTIILAKDGRTHSPIIQKYVINAAQDLGINVIDIETCPTPVFYYAIFNLETSVGMIITASHNPKEYNGIKICQNKRPVWGKQIQEIRKIYETKNFIKNKLNKKGIIKKYNIINDYINFLCSHFSHLKNKSLNAVIDCANGTAGTIFPQLIKKMNLKNIKLLYSEVNGNFPNHPADPTVFENMQDVYKELKNISSLNVGIGLDGDCDRMNPITKSGVLVPGDQLLAIFSKKILIDFPNAAIVFDIKSSSSLIELLKAWGAQDCICPSGHSLVKEAMLKNNAKLAGELSCHFFFNDRYFGYDDGIYACLRLFEILDESKQDLDELIKIFPQKYRSPEIRLSCPEENKKIIVETVKNFFTTKHDTKTIIIDGIRAQTNYGWGLIRASNTQPVICLRFESDTANGLKNIKQDFYNIIKNYFDEKKLREQIGI
ncbi:phosphomannomutase [Candidatus Dependentiae bacterium]|nr:phosphomannomutase [Candidatus Dependentiae bacterium]